MARIETDAEGEEDEDQARGVFECESGVDRVDVREEEAAADFEGARVVGGAEEEARERGAEELEGDVEDCTWEGGEAGEECGHCDEGVDVAAADGREAVDEDSDDDSVCDAADEWTEEGGGVEEAEPGVGWWWWDVWTDGDPAC